MRIKEIIGTRSIASVGRRAFDPSMEYAPTIRNGLLWTAPLRDNAKSIYDNGIVAYVDPSTQSVDPDGTYIDSYGIMQDAIEDVLCIEKNGARLGNTVTNELVRSFDFATSWIRYITDVNSNSDVAPDGTTTADTLTESNESDLGSARQTRTATDGVLYTHSVYIKKTAAKTFRSALWAQDTAGGGTQTYAVSLNAETGAATVITSGTYIAPTDFGVKDCGDYWRLWMVTTQSGTGNLTTSIYPAITTEAAPATQVLTATGSNVFWGAQREAGSFPTSYIPTEGSAVTRTKDELQYASSGNVVAGVGTWHAAITTLFDGADLASDKYVVDWSDGTDGIRIFFDASNAGKLTAEIFSGGASVTLVATNAPVRGVTVVYSLTWSDNDFVLYADAASNDTDTSQAGPLDKNAAIFVAQDNASASQLDGNAAHLEIYNRQFSAGEVTSGVAEIQGWTA